jgi:hypothetical protein
LRLANPSDFLADAEKQKLDVAPEDGAHLAGLTAACCPRLLRGHQEKSAIEANSSALPV